MKPKKKDLSIWSLALIILVSGLSIQWLIGQKNLAPSHVQDVIVGVNGPLTPLQDKVTQQDGTEAPYKNKYWDNKEAGLYVDIVSGEPLFSSIDKYDSRTGWPSFTRPLSEDFVTVKADYKLAVPRVEVRSAGADSHLGHIFEDGPEDKGGLRYCINSASLHFVPVSELGDKYKAYQALFR